MARSGSGSSCRPYSTAPAQPHSFASRLCFLVPLRAYQARRASALASLSLRRHCFSPLLLLHCICLGSRAFRTGSERPALQELAYPGGRPGDCWSWSQHSTCLTAEKPRIWSNRTQKQKRRWENFEHFLEIFSKLISGLITQSATILNMSLNNLYVFLVHSWFFFFSWVSVIHKVGFDFFQSN